MQIPYSPAFNLLDTLFQVVNQIMNINNSFLNTSMYCTYKLKLSNLVKIFSARNRSRDFMADVANAELIELPGWMWWSLIRLLVLQAVIKTIINLSNWTILEYVCIWYTFTLKFNFLNNIILCHAALKRHAESLKSHFIPMRIKCI